MPPVTPTGAIVSRSPRCSSRCHQWLLQVRLLADHPSERPFLNHRLMAARPRNLSSRATRSIQDNCRSTRSIDSTFDPSLDSTLVNGDGLFRRKRSGICERRQMPLCPHLTITLIHTIYFNFNCYVNYNFRFRGVLLGNHKSYLDVAKIYQVTL